MKSQDSPYNGWLCFVGTYPSYYRRCADYIPSQGILSKYPEICILYNPWKLEKENFCESMELNSQARQGKIRTAVNKQDRGT
jgi:hypothetical protein